MRVWALGTGNFIGTKLKTDITELKSKYKVNVSKLFEEFEIYNAHENDTCYNMGY